MLKSLIILLTLFIILTLLISLIRVILSIIVTAINKYKPKDVKEETPTNPFKEDTWEYNKYEQVKETLFNAIKENPIYNDETVNNITNALLTEHPDLFTEECLDPDKECDKHLPAGKCPNCLKKWNEHFSKSISQRIDNIVDINIINGIKKKKGL